MEDIFANYLIDDFHSERPQSLENDCLYVHVLLFIKNDTNKQKKNGRRCRDNYAKKYSNKA